MEPHGQLCAVKWDIALPCGRLFLRLALLVPEQAERDAKTREDVVDVLLDDSRKVGKADSAPYELCVVEPHGRDLWIGQIVLVRGE